MIRPSRLTILLSIIQASCLKDDSPCYLHVVQLPWIMLKYDAMINLQQFQPYIILTSICNTSFLEAFSQVSSSSLKSQRKITASPQRPTALLPSPLPQHHPIDFAAHQPLCSATGFERLDLSSMYSIILLGFNLPASNISCLVRFAKDNGMSVSLSIFTKDNIGYVEGLSV
ncbi:unnamed protein product [Vicia faba]|uniref:Uncharacterized protein n=1 Tax=Vicia faba TaxID=3906 RepID=A0AAV1A561_VICFA|nr:unnamed protein product [Vicia faba]